VTGTVLVRDARADELDRLPRIAETAVPPEVATAGGAVEPGKLADQLGGDRVFVAECDGRRAGYAAVSQRAGTLVLDQLVVAATDQGRHVGHRLLDWVEGYGVSQGLSAVQVPTAGVDARARDFYLRRGYVARAGVMERELVHL